VQMDTFWKVTSSLSTCVRLWPGRRLLNNKQTKRRERKKENDPLPLNKQQQLTHSDTNIANKKLCWNVLFFALSENE
jgi:hypothetical protein